MNNVDVTSVQQLIDVRNQLDRYAAPDVVDWHFANVNNRWTKRGLAAAGFGYPTTAAAPGQLQRWKPIYSVAEIGGDQSAAANAEAVANKRLRASLAPAHPADVEAAHEGGSNADSDSDLNKTLHGSKAYEKAHGGEGASVNHIAVLHTVNRPLFHVDLTAALESAVANAEARQAHQTESR